MRTTLTKLAARGVLEFSDGYRTRKDELGRSGFRIVRAGDLHSGRVHFDGPDFINPSMVKGIGRKVVQPGDVALTTKGTVGRAALVGDVPEPAVYSPQICYFRVLDACVLNAQFLLSWFRSQEFWAQASYLMSATDMAPYLSLKDIGNLDVDLPDLATQTAIADVLGALDDKIAANERVRRAVGALSSVLFASATRDSRTTRLGDCAKLNERPLKPGSGSIRYLDISSVGVGEFAEPIEIAWSEAPSRARRGVQDGDIIWSTVRPERRSHALILDPPSDLVCSTGLITITPTKVGSAFLYEATRTQEFVDFLVAGSTGSAYPATNAAVFLGAPIPLPEARVLGEFEAQMSPAWRRAAVAAEESRRLAATRDALLPELMSGRLPIRTLEDSVR
ncbi:restriction endonuclease subunit S [Tessaracoccus sp. G1721]